jgi:hypothetical protein
MITDTAIQELVKLDYEILDVVLEKKLRDDFKVQGIEFPEWLKKSLLDIMWLNYARWN